MIAIIAMIAIIGVGAGVMLSTNQAPQSPQVTQPVPSQSQEQLNDTEMMNNLNKSPEELSDDQKGYQGNEDLSSEPQVSELTGAANVLKKNPAHIIKPKPSVKSHIKHPAKPQVKPPKKPTVKPHKPPVVNNNDQVEEPWDPLEDPGENPDADNENDDGSDSGEDQTGDTGF